MGNSFKRSVEYKDAKASLLEKYKDNFDFIELGKLAIDYSDGIIEAGKEVKAELLEYARDCGKLVMPYPGEGIYDEPYDAFYSQVMGD